MLSLIRGAATRTCSSSSGRRLLSTSAARHSARFRRSESTVHSCISPRISHWHLYTVEDVGVHGGQRAYFSTTLTEQTEQFASLSLEDLTNTAIKYARQDKISEAQQVVHALIDRGEHSALSNLSTNFLDMWQRTQSRMLETAKGGKLTHLESDSLLEEMINVAEAATIVLEKISEPSAHHRTSVLSLWASILEAAKAQKVSKLRTLKGIPQRMEHILASEPSSTENYNCILKAWALSNEPLRGTMAQQTFSKIESPSGESFRWAMRASCWSGEGNGAFHATSHFMRMMKLIHTLQDFEPMIEDYHSVLESWSVSSDKNAPFKARLILDAIESAYKEGQTKLRADEKCFRLALTAMSRPENLSDVGSIVDSTLADMKERMIVPDSDSYGAAIKAWRNVAKARVSDNREAAAIRALELLHEMTKAFYRTTATEIRTTRDNYNHVLEALTASKNKNVITLAETLLTAMEKSSSELKDGVDLGIGPNADTYGYVMEILNKSKARDRVRQAELLLQRFEESHLRDVNVDTISDHESLVNVYNKFILVSSNSTLATEDEREYAMKAILRVAENLRRQKLRANAGTYSALIKACHKLVPLSKGQQRMIENVFRTCCDEGLVDQDVLSELQKSVSTGMYSKMVVTMSEEVEGIKVVPESWTRHINGFSARAKNGRRILPLSIAGKFRSTVASKSFRMRKLRRRSNKRMLEGGRS